MINYIFNILPQHLKLPLEYHYRYLTGNLEPELYYLKNLINKKRRAIDIGANKGFYTYAFSQTFDYIESFEPQLSCCQIITDFSKKTNNKKITVHECALSNYDGELKLHIPIIRGRINITLATGLASTTPPLCEHTILNVPVKTLDEYNFEDVDFIKIDVEGCESKVIEGAKETILKYKPMMLIEIEQRHLENVTIKSIFEKILSLGYEGYFLQNNQLIPIDKFNVNTYQNLSQYKSFYINNFIFLSSQTNH